MSIPRETTIEVCLIGIRLPRHVDFVFPSGSLSKRAAARNEQRKEIDFYLKAKGWTGGARQTRRVDESGSKNISITIDCQPVTNTRMITLRRCYTLYPVPCIRGLLTVPLVSISSLSLKRRIDYKEVSCWLKNNPIYKKIMATAPELQLPVCMQSFYIVKGISKLICNLPYLTADDHDNKTSRHSSHSP